MTVTEAQFEQWRQQAARHLQRYYDHPDYDDLLATAYASLWRAVSSADWSQVRDPGAYALRSAWLGAQDFLRSPANRFRQHTRHGGAAEARVISLAEMSPHEEPMMDDFAPALVERIAARQELARRSQRGQVALLARIDDTDTGGAACCGECGQPRRRGGSGLCRRCCDRNWRRQKRAREGQDGR